MKYCTARRHNRYRQFILAMEKRLITNSFAFRFGCSMHGMTFTDVFFAYRHFKDAKADFKELMGELAYKLMHNHFLPQAISPRTSPSVSRASPTIYSSEDSDHFAARHDLVKLKSIRGYCGGKQQRCVLCNRFTVWCCATCTTGPMALVPVCPARSNFRGVINIHYCHTRHISNPALLPGSRHRKGAKRARANAAEEGTQSMDLDTEDVCNDAEDAENLQEA